MIEPHHLHWFSWVLIIGVNGSLLAYILWPRKPE